MSIIFPSEIWSWCTIIQPSRVHSTENKTAQITKRCKLARSITAKTCKTNGCQTRGVCISYCTVRAVTITQGAAYNFCDSTQTLFYLTNTSSHFPSARLYMHMSAHAPTHPPVSWPAAYQSVYESRTCQCVHLVGYRNKPQDTDHDASLNVVHL